MVVAVALGLGATPSVTLRLDPLELGQVQVRIERPADGPAQVQVRAERPETLALLQRDAPELGRALQQAGIAQDQCRLSFSLGGGEPQDRQPGQGLGGSGQHHRGWGQQPGQPNPEEPTPRSLLGLLDIAV